MTSYIVTIRVSRGQVVPVKDALNALYRRGINVPVLSVEVEETPPNE
jgi:hypothetical protein